MPDIMLWVNKAAGDAADLGAVGREVEGLKHVSEVDVRTEGSVMHVSFEGGRAEQEEVEHVVREAGYEIFKASHREN